MLSAPANAAPRCDYRAKEIGTPAEFSKFFNKLKKVKSAKQLERYVSYPMKLNVKPERKVIKNRAQFMKNAKLIWSDRLKKALAISNFHFVYCSADGIMIGKGQIWINYQKKTYKIIALNP